MKHILGKLLVGCMALTLLLCGCISLKAEAKESTVSEQLNFLVVESSYLEVPGEQKVAVSVGNGKTAITDAVLNYTNKDSGKVYEKKAEKIIEDAMLFTMQFGQEEQTGIYELNSISYTADGMVQEIELAQLGKAVVFGVNKEVEESTYRAMEVQGTIEEEVAVVDEQGEQISEVSIAEALKNAETDTRVRLRASQRNNDKFVVALDPGHGGSDPGVVRIINGVTYSERDLVLKIAKFCKEELEKNGIEVCLTRTDNHSTLMNRKERTDYAVSKGASIIVSLHLNSTEATMGSASGSLVVVPDDDTESGELSQELALEILEKLELLGLNNRGTMLNEELGMVLYPKQYGIPGIIVEHAFLNNKNDVLDYLNSDAKLKKLGIADAQGIMEYMKNNSISFGNSTVYGGRDYKDVFNAEFYANRYGDLKNVYGTNAQKLLKHFVLYGMKEGRQGSEEFDPKAYRKRYGDLANAYGDNMEKYYWHYMVAGKAEGRDGKPEVIIENVTVYNGRDYKDVYNATYYYKRYGDLRNVYGKDPQKLLKHFVIQGMKEGRQGSEEFNVKIYRANYSDLDEKFGDDLEKYYQDYMETGKAEGRNGKTLLPPTEPENPDVPETPDSGNTVYDGRDYKDVFNAKYYADRYGDLKNAYEDNEEKLLKHFVLYGRKEGRQGNEEFNPKAYRARYSDLNAAYGDNMEKYYWHYMVAGKAEGRKGN